MTKKLEMVFSAPAMLRLNPQPWMENKDEDDKFLRCLRKSIKKIKNDVKEIYPQFDFNLSLLYNGYTEKAMGERFTTIDHGFDKLYSDSGGLQVVTLGKEVTQDIMKDVYFNQRNSDVAMAFDEIPARNDIVTGGKKHRSNIATRVYYPDMAYDCAVKTCENIKNQTDFFVNNNYKARSAFITQGNKFEDILKWFEVGVDKLSKDYWDNIIGFAMAGSCLGSGERETVENLLAYVHIINEYSDMHKKHHVHLLGYGSISRINPAFFMFNSNLVPDGSVLSFDSSSLSMNWMMGKLIGESGKPEEFRSEKDAYIKFTELVDNFYEIIAEEIGEFSKYDLIKHLVDNRRSMSTTTPPDITGNIIITAARCYLTIGLLNQIVNLMKGLHKQTSYDVLFSDIKHINTVNDLDLWFNDNKKHLNSKRIYRGNGISLDDFF